MKKYLITIGICFSIFNLLAQDLIYTVSGEIDENKTPLDSILVENITNETRILFDNLPELDYYQINLTRNAFWGSVGINGFEKVSSFEAVENSPGKLTVAYLNNTTTDAKLAVYTINGQKIHTSGRKIINPGNSINVKLSMNGMFFVKIETSFGISTFKTIGSGINDLDVPNVEISASSSSIRLKSKTNKLDDKISFLAGDSIQISAFKDGYNSTPLHLMIDSSKFINFLFELNSTGEIGSLTDSRDGKSYSTVTINGKELMTESLAYLPSVSKVTSTSKTEPHYYVYDYNDTIVSAAIATDNYKTYGALYNWPATKNACPNGWHMPTLDEWMNLTQFITDQNGLTHTSGDFWVGVGKYLKATSGWDNDGNGTDGYGFGCLPGGYRHMNANFYGIGRYGFWWTGTEFGSNGAFIFFMESNSDIFTFSHNDSDFGYCIRCMKDE